MLELYTLRLDSASIVKNKTVPPISGTGFLWFFLSSGYSSKIPVFSENIFNTDVNANNKITESVYLKEITRTSPASNKSVF